MKYARSHAPTDVVLAGLFSAPPPLKGKAREAHRQAPRTARVADGPAAAHRESLDETDEP
jgi:hypothetical protein